MRTLLFSFLFTFCLISVYCQDLSSLESSDSSNLSKTRYLISKENLKSLGIYFNGEILSSKILNTSSSFSQVGFNILFNEKIALGVFGATQLERNFTPILLSPTGEIRSRTSLGGGHISYNINPKNLINFSIPIDFGVGNIRADSTNYFRTVIHNHKRRASRSHENSNFGFISPGLDINLNLFKYGTLYLGAQYRIVTNIADKTIYSYNLQNKDLGGMSYNIGLKLGMFNLWRKNINTDL